MIIAYDGYLMQELTRACQTANDELQKAQSLILEVRSHNDWTCKEKDTIDDLMSTCRNMVQRLCEEEFSFLEAIKTVEGELSDAEKNVSRLFDGVETILSKVLAIPVAQTVVGGVGLLTGGIGDKVADVFDGITEGIGEKVQDLFEKISGDVDEQTVHHGLNESGFLTWPENSAPPSMELIESLGGKAMMTKNGDVEVLWPTGVKQLFSSEWTLELRDRLGLSETPLLNGVDVLENITETIKVVSTSALDF